MTTTTRSDALLDAAFRAIADGVSRGSLPSGVLAVANSEEVLRCEAFGPVATDSIFLLASITKSIFATSVLRLVERGLVLLNEPVTRHIPEFGANGKQDVLLWHLLTHTSGLDEGWINEHVRGSRRFDWQHMLEQTCAAPLVFRPGTRYAYANPPFVIMAELLQRVTQTEHACFLSRSVLEPLGMHDTSYAPADSSRVVDVLDPPWLTEHYKPGWIGLQHPAAGLWSTASDLVRFGQAMLREGELDGYRLLAPATVRAMTALQTAGVPTSAPSGESSSYYGLGFSKTGLHNSRGPSTELRSPAGFGHAGATGTLLWVEPEFDLVFVFLTNRWLQDDSTTKRALNVAIAALSAGTP